MYMGIWKAKDLVVYCRENGLASVVNNYQTLTKGA